MSKKVMKPLVLGFVFILALLVFSILTNKVNKKLYIFKKCFKIKENKALRSISWKKIKYYHLVKKKGMPFGIPLTFMLAIGNPA